MHDRTLYTFLACIFGVALTGCGQQRAAPPPPQNDGDHLVIDMTPKKAPKQDIVDVWAIENEPKQRFLDIAARIKAAGQKDPFRAIGAIFDTDADGAVKYDPRMGVTKEEYERFLQAPKFMKLLKTGETQIVIETNDDTVRITGLPKLDEIVFDAAKLSVKTPYGSIENGKSFAPNDRQFLTGKIAGFSWRSSSFVSLLRDEFTLWNVMLAQSQETREVWLSIRVKNNETRQDQLHYFVRFSGPRN
jgi:hypothetical protein